MALKRVAESVAVAVAVLCAVGPVLAQTPAPVAATTESTSGLNAGVSFGIVGVSFGDGDAERRGAYRMELGYRFPLWRRGFLHDLRLTPKIGLLATDVTGMDPDTDAYAYASVDLAMRATYARRRLRPFAEYRRALPTAERLDSASRILNFKGSGSGWGLGVEVPITPSKRGLEIGVTATSGDYTKYELEHVQFPARLRYRSVAVLVGWSGSFTGISLPWQ